MGCPPLSKGPLGSTLLSWFLRVAMVLTDMLGSLLGLVGFDPARIEPAALVDRAKAKTGLSDMGTLEYPEALDVICESIRQDVRPCLSGRLALRDILTTQVSTRLKLIELKKRHPEGFEGALNRPVFVLGLPRSGTTFLHGLLVEGDDARGFPLWLVREPFHLDGPDHRRRDTLRLIRLLKLVSPDVDTKHRFDVDVPEEDGGFFDAALWTPTNWRVSACRSYLDWQLAQDATAAYRVYRDVLTWMQNDTPDRRLVLKMPNHVGFLDILLEVFPEAAVVQMHRDPVAVMASYSSLAYSVRAGVAPQDRHKLGEASLHLWSTMVERGMAAREAAGDRVLDVLYTDLVKDPVGTVKAICEHFDLPFDDDFKAKLKRLVSERVQHKYGKHVYALEDYGLTKEDVEARFAHYITTYLRVDS